MSEAKHGQVSESEKYVAKALESLHAEVEEVKKATSNISNKLTEMDNKLNEQMTTLNEQMRRLIYSWPPVLLIEEVEGKRVVSSTNLRVNEVYKLLFRGRGVEEKVRIKLEGSNISRFSQNLR